MSLLRVLLAYTPFVQPLPRAWDFWYLLLLPLCLGVAVVYKSIKCASMRHVPREATVVFLSIIGGILFAAAVLAIIVKFVA
jgi:hypothetical protein